MKFWFSSETMADIADPLRIARNEIEGELNRTLSKVNYGSDLREWAFLPVILSPSTLNAAFPEIRRYDPALREVEFRLSIAHRAFRERTPEEQRRLIFARLLSSVDLAQDLAIPDFDLNRLKRDLTAVGQKHGWIG